MTNLSDLTIKFYKGNNFMPVILPVSENYNLG
jgi:hypothetical protein